MRPFPVLSDTEVDARLTGVRELDPSEQAQHCITAGPYLNAIQRLWYRCLQKLTPAGSRNAPSVKSDSDVEFVQTGNICRGVSANTLKRQPIQTP